MATIQAPDPPSSVLSRIKCNSIAARMGFQAKRLHRSKSICMHHRISDTPSSSSKAASFTILLLILLCLTWIVGLADVDASSIKPPRGYCTQISRAVSPKSRCYKHLVGTLNTGSGNPESISMGPIDLKGAPEQRQQQRHEELVYVRLETLGRNIRELNTRPINERLAMGVFAFLMGNSGGNAKLGEEAQTNRIGSSSSNGSSGSGTVKATRRDIRAQILDSPPGSEGFRLAEKCQQAMERFICRLAYPSCHFRRADVSALVRPPCREDCLLLRDVLCASLDWQKFGQLLAEAFNATLRSAISALDLEVQGDLDVPSSNQVGDQHYLAPAGYNSNSSSTSSSSSSSSNHFYWPHEHSIERCESLPPLRFEHAHVGVHNQGGISLSSSSSSLKATTTMLSGNGKEELDTGGSGRRFRRRIKWPICSDAHLTRTPMLASERKLFSGGRMEANETVKVDDQCLETSDGIGYRGAQNSTRSGLACQPWQSQRPHQHTSSELLFDNMREAHNYCRNPGGTELEPWCYTQDAGVRWEYCAIKRC